MLTLLVPLAVVTVSREPPWGKHPIPFARISCLAFPAMEVNQNLHTSDTSEPLCAPPSFYSPHRRILAVDDDRLIRQLNCEVLTRNGYHVDTAQDGEAGWQALHAVRDSSESYDLLITDHDMPGLSGVDLVKRLRAVRMSLPVVFASGKLPTDAFTRIHWLQPAAMLLKPYTVAELLETVEAILCAADDSACVQLELSSVPVELGGNNTI